MNIYMQIAAWGAIALFALGMIWRIWKDRRLIDELDDTQDDYISPPIRTKHELEEALGIELVEVENIDGIPHYRLGGRRQN